MFHKLSLSLIFTFTLLLGACAPTAPAPMPVPPTAMSTLVPTAAPTAEPTAIPVFPLTLTDGAGRKVTIESAPARIVSLSPSNTEILFAVGAGKLVVGDTKYCDFPVEAQNLTKIGGFSADSISVETIVSLKPDLVLANSSGHEPVIKALTQANIKVIALDAKTFEDVYSNIELVGKITDHETEAVSVVDGMKSRVAAVTQKIASVAQDKRPTVFWEVWNEPLMTAGPNTFFGQMIGLAGGVSIFADVTGDWPQVSAEEIIKRNPDFILGPDSHGDKLTADLLAARPGWTQISAVKNGKIYLIDGNTSSRPGPRLVNALEAIAKALYPDLFK